MVDPALHALLPEARREERLRREVATPRRAGARTPLYGVPFGVKDVIRTGGLPTQAGSRLPASEFAGAEATCVRLLREAGGVVFGKTVSTEFAFFHPGATLNPYDTRYSPGGSSSGSAAGVAAGLFPFALGTQTIGSTIKPASFCGIAGFKPSHDRIPRGGLVFCAESLDDIGILAQDIDGVRTVASVLCDGWDGRRADGGDLPTLGVPEGPYLDQLPPDGRVAFRTLLDELRTLGYVVKTVPLFERWAEIRNGSDVLVAREMADYHREWFAAYEPLYAARTRENILAGRAVTDSAYHAARDGRIIARHEVDDQAGRSGVDCWITPATLGPAPLGITTTGDSSMNLAWSYTGLPSAGIPAWTTSGGLPVGLQLIGRYGADERLLAHAAELSRSLDAGSTVRAW